MARRFPTSHGWSDRDRLTAQWPDSTAQLCHSVGQEGWAAGGTCQARLWSILWFLVVYSARRYGREMLAMRVVP